MGNSVHRSYSAREIELLRQTPMAAILSDLGYRTDHTRGNLYYSPFREERTPSFHVNDVDHKWCDFGDVDSRGAHPGGDTISLVERLLNCKLPEALSYLERLSASPSIEAYRNEVISAAGSSSGSAKIHLTGVKDRIGMDVLSNYGIYERHIPANILNRYCFQVNFYLEYQNGERSRNRYSIGFPNIDGDWALRSPLKKGGKLSTGSNYTVIAANGDFLYADAEGKLHRNSSEGPVFSPEERAANIVVIEGFFDALSYLAWKGIETPGDADLVVLNSVSNTRRAMGFILDHEKVVTYLDNDETGRRFSALIAEDVAQARREGLSVEHVDGSYAFKDYGDLNEAWCAKCREAQQKALAEKVHGTETPQKPQIMNSTQIHEKDGLRYYVGDVTPGKDIIFVFGSNPEGRHGTGAAKVAAEKFGAVYGQGEGLQGSAYAIPTKDLRVKTDGGRRSISPESIRESVKRLYDVAIENPDKQFCVAYRNTDKPSLNGYTGREMMRMFLTAGAPPRNIVFSEEWARELLSQGQAVSAGAPAEKPQAALPDLLSFSESSEGYSGCTYENAQAPDVDFTVAFATNFQTAGEKCTARAAGKSLIPVDVFVPGKGLLPTAENAAARIYAALPAEFRDGKPVGINIAGNSLATFSTYEQKNIDVIVALTFKVLRQSGINVRSFRSGGRRGADEAAVAAAQTLGVPVHIHAPKDWKWRDERGVDHTGEQAFKARFAMTSEKEDLIRSLREHNVEGVDRTVPVLFKTAAGKYNYMDVDSRKVLLYNDVDRADFFYGEVTQVSVKGITLEINREGVVTRNLTQEENQRRNHGHSIR